MWNRRCKGKREVRKMYRRWRKGKIGRNCYLEERRKFKNLLEEVQKLKRTREEEELRNMKRETEVWNFINKKRGLRKWNGNNIGEEEWRRYFMGLLEGEDMEVRKRIKTVDTRRNTGEEIGIEEVRKAIKKLKGKKAAGVDGIPMEAWKFAGEEMIKELTDLIRLIWRQGILPREWRKSIIVPLYKRGDKEIRW